MSATSLGLWLGASLLTAQAGVFRHRHVTSVEVDLETGPARVGEAIPGHPIPLTVTLVDDRGNRRVTEADRPRHLWRKLEVQVEGGHFNPDRAVVVPDPAGTRSRDDLQQANLVVKVTPVRRRSMARTERRSLDWRAVFGPLASEVTHVALVTRGPELMDDHWLLPGSQLQAAGHVTDRQGRTYRTDRGPVRIPWDRLQLTTEGLTQHGHGKLTAQRTRTESPYVAELVLPGAEVATFHTEWVRDWERIDGPKPEAITGLTVAVLTDRDIPDGELPPGAITPVLIEATTQTGRTFTTKRGARLSLPSSRLVVRPTHGRWNPGPQTVSWSDDLRGMVGKTFGLHVAYADRPDTGTHGVWEPDFLHVLRTWRTPGEHVAASPQPYATTAALAGPPGPHGADGVDVRNRRRGRDGGDAGDGADGVAGMAGPELTLTAWSTTTLDGRHSVVLYVLDGPDGRSVHTVLPGQRPVYIETRGGDGAAGGRGGQGGAGGDGASACRPGSGGDGGRGGRGGRGGAGGFGGSVRVFVDHPATARHFEVQSVGGQGGAGGVGGQGGQGGRPGGIIAPLQVEAEADGHPASACMEADLGADGMRGAPGPAGPNGQPGRIDVRTDPLAVRSARSALPPRLREATP